jgi:hypothetical protein
LVFGIGEERFGGCLHMGLRFAADCCAIVSSDVSDAIIGI